MIPEKGFYYHYRHDQSGAVNNCAYEVLGTAFNTESKGAGVHSDSPEDFFEDEVVVYRPLYESSIVYNTGKRFWYRPVKMFFESVTKDEKTFPRFRKITDPAVIAELVAIRDRMYSDSNHN